MEYTTILVILSITWTSIFILTTTLYRRKSATTTTTKPPPPGPYPYPIIGNIFQLGPQPHQTLAKLSKTYGPLMSLKLGSKTTIVVSSPKIAKEMLQKHDLTFSSRSPSAAANTLSYLDNSIVWLPVGTLWKSHRKICKEQVFATNRLDESQGLRKKVLNDLLDYAQECCLKGEAIDIGGVGHTTTLNLLSNFFFSFDLARHDSVSSQDFKDTMWALMENGGKANFADYFPAIQRFDLQGIRRKSTNCFRRLFGILDRIIDQRIQERGSSLRCNDALDSMLNLHLKEESELSHDELRNLVMDLFIAGTDTTSSTIEWAMSELIHDPKKMAKARSELNQVTGQDGAIIEESDIPKLPYLQAVVKETLRLHPPAPFLIPRKADANVEISHLTVPKNAQILVNVWAIGRDPSVWSEPESFKPERFLDNGIDFKGQDFELIPFGAGRRICPGLPLAHKMLHLMLGSLVKSFEWKLEGEMEGKDMDMRDKFGLTIKKAVSLKAIPINLNVD